MPMKGINFALGCAVMVLASLSAQAQHAPAASGSPASSPTPAPPAMKEVTPAAPAPSPAPAAPAAPVAPAPTSPEHDAASPPEFSAEDVLKAFEKERPQAEPLLPRGPEDESVVRTAPTQGGLRPGRGRMPDGYFLVDRTGRLTQEGAWWTFNFVADNNPETAPEPPIRLLPNQMLERMVRESQGGTTSVEFIVSGEVTDFLGDNYLMLRKLMRKRDQGNLSR